MKTVVGMFSDVSEAQRSFEELMKFGIGSNDISIVTKQRLGVRSGNGLTLSTVEAPDAGSIAVRGPIAAMLTRDRRRLTSTLESAGVSPALAEHYAKAVRDGETLEFVVVDDTNANRIVEIMKRHAARYNEASVTGDATTTRRDLERSARTREGGLRGEASGTLASAGSNIAGVKSAITGTVERAKEAITERTGSRGDEPTERIINRSEPHRYIPILREELQVGKREVERGAVHVGVRVTERPVSEHVKLREEHVEIERRPADRAPRPDEAEFRAGELDMIERGEEVVVSKQVRVVEEVRLHRHVTEHDETINDKLRSTQVDIDQLAGDRRAYAFHYASLGGHGNFEEARPAYEFGRGLRRLQTERWEEIEPNARLTWEAQHPGTWHRFHDAIRYAWSRARSS